MSCKEILSSLNIINYKKNDIFKPKTRDKRNN